MSGIEVGTMIADRYRVVGRLGQGGMGVVYEAVQEGLERSVALKMLLRDVSARDDDRIRFQREARVMSRLRHDNAVNVFDYGEWEGRLYLVMEKLTGVTLRSRMVDGEPYDLDETLRIAWQLSDVLVAAHDLSLVHRDLKPSNVMIEPRSDGSERAVVVDFGLAFMEAAGPDLARLTKTGLVSGTPQYMSPEQARGREDLGPPADIYALGGMLYELTTGRAPFLGRKAIDLLNQHLFVPPQPMREVAPDLEIPRALDEIVLQALAKSSFDRPSAPELRERLGQLIVGDTPRGRGRPERLNEPRSQRVLTQRPNAKADTIAGHAPRPSVDQTELLVVAIDGELSTNRHVSFRAAGLFPEPWRPDATPGVLFRPLSDEPCKPDRYDGWGVVLEIEADTTLEQITQLMRQGVKDVVRHPAEDAAVIRKIRRVARTLRRRSADD